MLFKEVLRSGISTYELELPDEDSSVLRKFHNVFPEEIPDGHQINLVSQQPYQTAQLTELTQKKPRR